MVARQRRREHLEPPKPSEFLRELMKEHGVTQDSLAGLLRTTRYTVNQLVNDRRSVTAEMALRLAKVFSNSPEFWLNLQRHLDVERARRRLGKSLETIKPLRKPTGADEMFYDVDS